MFDADKKSLAKMAPKLQRVLIADPQPASARVISDIMRDNLSSRVWLAESTDRALKLAETCEPQIIFTELSAGAVDGLEFTKKLRRSRYRSRMTPVIMVTSTATAAAILAARDAGVHEFLRKPFNMKDLTRRLEAVALRERDWVEAMGYVGPDRRRFNSGDYKGPRKRQNDAPENPQEARITQALKILRSAIAGCEKDPEQAMRSLLAQASTIQQAATELKDLKLTMAAATFHRQLAALAHGHTALDKGQLERWAGPLLALLPKGDGERRAA